MAAVAAFSIGSIGAAAETADAGEKEIERYREMINDPMANPGYLNFDRGEILWKYAKIFNAQSVQPCSIMPRFGYHKFLSIEQIKDVTAYLMSPDSPVNK